MFSLRDQRIEPLPPKSQYITGNLICDLTEVTNLDWMEYTGWVARNYGRNSTQFKASLPDTNVWLQTKYPHLVNEYFQSRPDSPRNTYGAPAFYSQYPVVGISQEQAVQFSKWRTDRVLEMQLIGMGIIDSEPNPDSTNYFTAEKYFSGNYKHYKPDPRIEYYAVYTLPDETDRAILLDKFSEKDSSGVFDRNFVTAENHEQYFDLFQSPTRPVSIHNEVDKILNLIGNVSEWSQVKNRSFGGGWKQALKEIEAQDEIECTEPNAWTGMRNVCKWKSIKEGR